MKSITMFYMDTCPHCHNAFRMMDKLFEAHPEYRDIPIKMVEETKEAALANTYDYWYVPTFYVGEEKLHEGVPTQAAIDAVFAKAYDTK